MDYSIHLFHNYVAEVQKGYSIGEAIVSSVKDVGNALFLATLTTCIVMKKISFKNLMEKLAVQPLKRWKKFWKNSHFQAKSKNIY